MTKFVLAAAAAMAFASPALADSISPTTFSGTTTVGGTLSLSKVVTVSKGTPTAGKADIFFLSDTTGSMGPTIAAVQASFGTIAASLSGDIGFGVGQFKDSGDAFVYKKDLDITTSVAAAQTAINGWTAGGGGDFPEQALYALGQVATTTTWRSGAKRIVVLAGDAPAKTDLITLAGAASTLVANKVTVESIDVDPPSGLNNTGQFSGPGSIYAAGVSGQYFTSTNPATLAATIQSAIGAAFLNYTNVTLAVSGLAPGVGVGVTFAPSAYSGTFDRSIDRTFNFALTFTGLTVGVYDFTINALVDGGIVATETDHIVVTGVPEASTWAMMLAGFGIVGRAMRYRRRKTSVSFG